MDDVITRGQGLSEGDLEVHGARFECEMLIAECGRSSDFIDGYDDKREIEVIGRTVGNLDRTINAVPVNLRRAKPVEHQACRDYRLNLFTDSIRRTGGVFNGHGVGESSGFWRPAYQKAVRCKRNSVR
jgi:hypothetical protein